MILSQRLNRAALTNRSAAPAPRQSVRKVMCNAAATKEAGTAWDSWTSYMKTRKGIADADAQEKSSFSEIGEAISKSAVGYKPKFSQGHEPHAASFKLQHLDKINIDPKELPKDLHDKLEAIGVAALKGALKLEGELDYANVSYTTTDIDAALSVTGTVIQQGSDRNAVVVFVVTETERQASWSRLEGLILHWACAGSIGSAWAMPPEGWSAAPSKTRDAGGAWQCQFEKQVMGGQEVMYVLVMQLPLRGVLKSGGVVCVLKGTANQADRWLKDAATDKDFFLDLQKLPVTKL